MNRRSGARASPSPPGRDWAPPTSRWPTGWPSPPIVRPAPCAGTPLRPHPRLTGTVPARPAASPGPRPQHRARRPHREGSRPRDASIPGDRYSATRHTDRRATSPPTTVLPHPSQPDRHQRHAPPASPTRWSPPPRSPAQSAPETVTETSATVPPIVKGERAARPMAPMTVRTSRRSPPAPAPANRPLASRSRCRWQSRSSTPGPLPPGRPPANQPTAGGRSHPRSHPATCFHGGSRLLCDAGMHGPCWNGLHSVEPMTPCPARHHGPNGFQAGGPGNTQGTEEGRRKSRSPLPGNRCVGQQLSVATAYAVGATRGDVRARLAPPDRAFARWPVAAEWYAPHPFPRSPGRMPRSLVRRGSAGRQSRVPACPQCR